VGGRGQDWWKGGRRGSSVTFAKAEHEREGEQQEEVGEGWGHSAWPEPLVEAEGPEGILDDSDQPKAEPF